MRSAGIIVLMLASVLLAACGTALPLPVASTAFAPTIPPPPGTLISGTEPVILTPEAAMAGVIQAPGQEHRYTFHGEAGKAVTVVTLPVGHHQMTETPDETLAALQGFLKG